MKIDAALADRKQSIRDEAREWFRGSLIDEAAFHGIERMYPDDRVRAGTAFRLLFFVLTYLAIIAAVGAVCAAVSTDETLIAMLAIVAGAGCWLITNHLVDTSKRRQGGIEAAFSAVALNCMISGIGIFLFTSHSMRSHSAAVALLFVSALLLGLAAWVWGYWVYSALAAAALFFAVMNIWGGRFIWILLVVLAYPKLVECCDSAKLPPSIRKCFAAFLAVSGLAMYAAVNVFLLDGHSIEAFRKSQFFPRWLAIALTAILPAVVLAIGVIKRRRTFLVLGFALLLFSLMTVRAYMHVAPLWLILTGAGALLLICAEGFRRFLESGVCRERYGYTADPLMGQPERHKAAEMIASITTLTPEPSPQNGEPSKFDGGGGQFGGGGASGKF